VKIQVEMITKDQPRPGNKDLETLKINGLPEQHRGQSIGYRRAPSERAGKKQLTFIPKGGGGSTGQTQGEGFQTKSCGIRMSSKMLKPNDSKEKRWANQAAKTLIFGRHGKLE